MFRFLFKKVFLSVACMVSLYSCDNIDCPLLNTAYAKYGFYDVSGEAVTLVDTLTVSPYGRDTVLVNQLYDVKSVYIPVSYAGDADTLLFQFRTDRGVFTDTLVFTHTNEPHFESIDCNTAIFHTVTGLVLKNMNVPDATSVINQVTIENATINYDPKEHFKLYLNRR